MQYEKNQEEEVEIAHNVLRDKNKNILVQIMLMEVN